MKIYQFLFIVAFGEFDKYSQKWGIHIASTEQGTSEQGQSMVNLIIKFWSLKQHKHLKQGPYRALEYLHRQAYPIAEYKRSDLDRLDRLTITDPTDSVLNYIYANARPYEFASKPVFKT